MLLRDGSRSHLLVAACAVLAVTVAGVGCGGGSSKPESLTKPEFVKEADAICVKADEERKQGSKELTEGDGGTQSEEAAAVTESLVAPVRAMTEELGELGPPKGDEKQVDAIVAAFESGVAKLEEDPGAPESATAFGKANELAAAYGLTECTI